MQLVAVLGSIFRNTSVCARLWKILSSPSFVHGHVEREDRKGGPILRLVYSNLGVFEALCTYNSTKNCSTNLPKLRNGTVETSSKMSSQGIFQSPVVQTFLDLPQVLEEQHGDDPVARRALEVRNSRVH